MKNEEKGRKIRNFDADDIPSANSGESVASMTEATGMMYAPPRTEAEVDSITALHELQAPQHKPVGRRRRPEQA